MAAKKILMLVGDYVEDYEVMVPFQMLLMVGHQVDAVCPGKKAGESRADGGPRLRGRPDLQREARAQLHAQCRFRCRRSGPVRRPGHSRRPRPGVSPPQRAGAPDRPPLCPGQQTPGRDLPRAADSGGRRGGDGRRCTAYPAVKPDLVRAGAVWKDVNETFSNAVGDGNLVTAAAWPGHPQWMRKFLKVLGTKIEP